MKYLQSDSGQARVFLYDADDERILSFDCAFFGGACGTEPQVTATIRGLDSKVLRVYNNVFDGSSWQWERDYVYRDGLLLASVEPGGGGPEETRHLHLDHLGSPRQITDESAVEVAFHTYYPFGEEATDPSQDDVRLKFTGHERDNNGGASSGMLDYMHSRFCGPGFGRFLSVDPISSAKPPMPQTWNLYAYVANNPIRFIDPTGLYLCSGSSEECSEFIRAFAEVGAATEALPEGSEDREMLQKILDFYGEKGVENGVEVTFGPTVSCGPAEAGFRPGERRFFGLGRRAQGTSVIKFDLEQKDSIEEFAARISHEGSHGIDQQAVNAQVSLSAGLASEYRAYWAQAATYRGLGFESSYQLWSVQGDYSLSSITALAIKSMRTRCSQVAAGTRGCP